MDFNESFQKARSKSTRLVDLKITRVDLVERGANLDESTGLGSHVMIFKHADESHEGPPEEMQILHIERVAGVFTDVGVKYADALTAIMKNDPAMYRAYRAAAYR